MCDTCVNYVYDEDDESWVCCVDMDEDDHTHDAILDTAIDILARATAAPRLPQRGNAK